MKDLDTYTLDELLLLAIEHRVIHSYRNDDSFVHIRIVDETVEMEPHLAKALLKSLLDTFPLIPDSERVQRDSDSQAGALEI